MKWNSLSILAIFALAVSLLPAASAFAAVAPKEKLPAGAKVLAVEARPAAVDLKHQYAYAQLVLTGRLESGERIDVTRMAETTLPGELVTVSTTGLVRPHADGSGQLTFSVGGQSVAV